MGAAIIDVDGTLVDSNYQHALAWHRAFRSFGAVVPVWKAHRHIGMGGDQLVPALTDEQFEREHGEEAREAEHRNYMEMIEEVTPFAGARELIVELNRRGHRVVLASSAQSDELDHYLDLLDLREIVHAWTSASDVEATKPAPDLVEVALEKAGVDATEATMIGDTPWDAHAAGRADVPMLGVLSGGFAREELLDAGVAQVFETVAEMKTSLDTTRLR